MLESAESGSQEEIAPSPLFAGVVPGALLGALALEAQDDPP